MVTFQVAQSTSQAPDDHRKSVRRLGSGALLTTDFPPAYWEASATTCSMYIGNSICGR
jgi:hypothetical protein